MLQDQVYFVCYSLFERPAKIASSLAMRGTTVRLITCIIPTYIPWLRLFDSIEVVESVESFLKILKNVPSNIPIHHFSSSIDALTIALLKSDRLFIYDYKDVYPKVLNLPCEGHEQVLDIMVKRNLPVFFRDSQFNCFLEAENLSPPKIYRHLPDFVWPRIGPSLTRLDSILKVEKRFSTVFIGNFSIETIDPHHAGLGQIPVIESLIGQGITYTMFPFRSDGLDKDPIAMRDYIAISKANKLFRLESRTKLSNLQHRLREMGWGVMIAPYFHFPKLTSKHFLKKVGVGLPTRFSDYIGAGLPIICSEGAADICDLLRTYDIGIIVGHDEISSLREKLADVSYPRIRQNVDEFSERFLSPHRWADSIVEYYTEAFE